MKLHPLRVIPHSGVDLMPAVPPPVIPPTVSIVRAVVVGSADRDGNTGAVKWTWSVIWPRAVESTPVKWSADKDGWSVISRTPPAPMPIMACGVVVTMMVVPVSVGRCRAHDRAQRGSGQCKLFNSVHNVE